MVPNLLKMSNKHKWHCFPKKQKNPNKNKNVLGATQT
jgi:hypothetical protein